MEIPKIKSWLDKLYGLNGQRDFELQILEKEGIKTKRKTYLYLCDYENPKIRWFLSKVNQRQILPIESVLDIENKTQINEIVSKLKELGLEFYVFTTGSRGYHVHIFYDRDLTDEERLSIIEYFGADTQKASGRTMIALEFSCHWKSKKIKELIEI